MFFGGVLVSALAAEATATPGGGVAAGFAAAPVVPKSAGLTMAGGRSATFSAVTTAVGLAAGFATVLDLFCSENCSAREVSV